MENRLDTPCNHPIPLCFHLKHPPAEEIGWYRHKSLQGYWYHFVRTLSLSQSHGREGHSKLPSQAHFLGYFVDLFSLIFVFVLETHGYCLQCIAWRNCIEMCVYSLLCRRITCRTSGKWWRIYSSCHFRQPCNLSLLPTFADNTHHIFNISTYLHSGPETTISLNF